MNRKNKLLYTYELIKCTKKNSVAVNLQIIINMAIYQNCMQMYATGSWVLLVQSDSIRKDCIRLLLKQLPSAVIVTCRGWDSCTSSDDSLSIILLSPTTCTGSRGQQRMELAFLTSLSNLLLPAAEMLLLQQTTPKKWLRQPQSHRKR